MFIRILNEGILHIIAGLWYYIRILSFISWTYHYLNTNQVIYSVIYVEDAPFFQTVCQNDHLDRIFCWSLLFLLNNRRLNRRLFLVRFTNLSYVYREPPPKLSGLGGKFWYGIFCNIRICKFAFVHWSVSYKFKKLRVINRFYFVLMFSDNFWSFGFSFLIFF